MYRCPAYRSLGGWAIKAMKVLGIDIEDKILDFVSDKVEGQLQPGPGLYRCSEAAADGLQPVRSLDGDGPVGASCTGRRAWSLMRSNRATRDQLASREEPP